MHFAVLFWISRLILLVRRLLQLAMGVPVVPVLSLFSDRVSQQLAAPKWLGHTNQTIAS
jgi:hypothetical protein